MVFVLALISLLVVFGSSIALLAKSEDSFSGGSVLYGMAGILGLLATLAGACIYFGLVWQWFASEAKANILEREYGVKYSQSEMFFASDVINTVRELDRKRIEINGDFRRERDPQRDLPKPDNR